MELGRRGVRREVPPRRDVPDDVRTESQVLRCERPGEQAAGRTGSAHMHRTARRAGCGSLAMISTPAPGTGNTAGLRCTMGRRAPALLKTTMILVFRMERLL